MKKIIITLSLLLTTIFLVARGQAPYLASSAEQAGFEEAYVNDIPFDTWMISKTTHPGESLMELPEEKYIDDIPFNTAKIAQKVLLSRMLKQNEETVVNDIPFSTDLIYNEILMAECTEKWKNEESVNDLPCESLAIIYYDARRDLLIYQSGSTMNFHGFQGLNSTDFMIDTEKYMMELDEKLREMENLSFGYPF